MGSATVIADQGGGLYTVQVDRGSTKLQRLIDIVNARIAELDQPIADARDDYETAVGTGDDQLRQNVDDANLAFLNAIDERCLPEGFQADPLQDIYTSLRSASLQLIEQREALDALIRDRAEIEADLADVEKLVSEAEQTLEDAQSNADDAWQALAAAVVDRDYREFVCCTVENDCHPSCWEAEERQVLYKTLEFEYAYFIFLPQAQDQYDAIAGELSRVQTDLAQVTQQITDTEDQITDLEEQTDALLEDYKQALIDNNDLLEACNPNRYLEEAIAVDKAMIALMDYLETVDDKYAILRQLEAEQQSLLWWRDTLIYETSAIVTKEQLMWCADLTEGTEYGTVVATHEIPGEPGYTVIAPACRAPAADDGQVIAREVMSPSQAYYNAAILPGWQKWQPTFRIGTLSDLDKQADTATVTLDAATSTAQGLAINQSSILSAVPIEYMTCNAEAFENDDRVVVQFIDQEWGNPKVIGFESNPRGCYSFVKVIFSPILFRQSPNASGDFATYCGGTYYWWHDYEWFFRLPGGDSGAKNPATWNDFVVVSSSGAGAGGNIDPCESGCGFASGISYRYDGWNMKKSDCDVILESKSGDNCVIDGDFLESTVNGVPNGLPPRLGIPSVWYPNVAFPQMNNYLGYQWAPLYSGMGGIYFYRTDLGYIPTFPTASHQLWDLSDREQKWPAGGGPTAVSW